MPPCNKPSPSRVPGPRSGHLASGQPANELSPPFMDEAVDTNPCQTCLPYRPFPKVVSAGSYGGKPRGEGKETAARRRSQLVAPARRRRLRPPAGARKFFRDARGQAAEPTLRKSHDRLHARVRPLYWRGFVRSRREVSHFCSNLKMAGKWREKRNGLCEDQHYGLGTSRGVRPGLPTPPRRASSGWPDCASLRGAAGATGRGPNCSDKLDTGGNVRPGDDPRARPHAAACASSSYNRQDTVGTCNCRRPVPWAGCGGATPAPCNTECIPGSAHTPRRYGVKKPAYYDIARQRWPRHRHPP